MLAWHFLSDDGLLRDVSKPPADGEWLEHDGELKLCKSGLHASVRAIDALNYAPGHIVCRVECDGEIKHGGDKLVCSRRKVLWRYDAAEVLRHFGRLCALDVIHLWDCPDVVRRYLETGDESISGEASAAAGAAAYAATRAAAWPAADAAARAAADAASRAASRDAVDAAAWAAADAAADAAAWAAACDESWYAAYAAARDAARQKQNDRLERMLHEGRPQC